jgi:hypothetical protein
LELSKGAANNLVNEFVRLGILQEITKKKQYRKFVFAEYLKLFDERDL